MAEEIEFNNPCCCDCSLQEGVGWIAAFEFLWGIINAVVGISYMVVSQNADKRIRTNSSTDLVKDRDWRQFGDEHQHGISGLIGLHCVELILAVFLMLASSRRIRNLCFMWIVIIGLVLLAEIAVTALDPFSLTFILVGINPIRLYFAFIVFSLASEILRYPQGPPRIIAQPVNPIYVERPVYGSAPVVMPAYGYSPYGYSPYGYGYSPYGYGYGDSALLGAGLGLGLGLGLGGGYGGYGGGGYYDDCYF